MLDVARRNLAGFANVICEVTDGHVIPPPAVKAAKQTTFRTGID